MTSAFDLYFVYAYILRGNINQGNVLLYTRYTYTKS